MIERQALALNQSENDFSRSRRARIDNHHIAVTRIAEVMVDVDPNFCRTNRGEHGSQPTWIAVSSAMATSTSSAVAGGLVNNSERGRNEYFSSIPSSFQTRTSLPSC